MIKQVREIIRGFEEDEGPAALYARLDRLKAFLSAYEEVVPPTSTDEAEPIAPGSVVQLKSGGPLMTVTDISRCGSREPHQNDAMYVLWIKPDGKPEDARFLRFVLKHAKPEPERY